ncbi:MAG: type I-F CRISPR-associated protein Csy2 [Arenicella sp.]
MGMKKLLIIPRLKIHNANALSSPFTIGFPAMTAWLGATHALQRKLNDNGMPVVLSATGVVSHAMDLQTYRGENDYVASIVGTANPLDKTGARSAFIEEARCHLEVSLMIEITGVDSDQYDELTEQVSVLLNANMKMAGGDIQTFQTPDVFLVDDDQSLQKLKRKLMPGYVLIERRELMAEAMEQGQDALDALLDYLVIHHQCEKDDEGLITWNRQRKTYQDKPAGWVVPIATGFHGISELAKAKNQRDPDMPHRFAESLVTLGEFKMPFRFNSVEAMLWRYHFDADNNLYQCRQSTGNSAVQVAETLEDEFS